MSDMNDPHEKRRTDRSTTAAEISLEKTGVTTMFQIIREMASEVAGLKASFDNYTRNGRKERQEVLDKIQELSHKIDDVMNLKQAFVHVDGKPDVFGHRTDHEVRSKNGKSLSRLYAKVKEEAFSKVIIFILVWAAVVFGMGFKEWASNVLTAWLKPTATQSTPSVPALEKKHE